MITCPHCGFEQSEASECLKCGIVFRKYAQRRSRQPARTLRPAPATRHWAARLFAALKIGVPLAGLAWVASLFFIDRLPPPQRVSERLLSAPVQRPVSVAPFEVRKKDITYRINPLYDYELHGLVVSQHRADAWNDIYHLRRWKDFINLKDLCVIWGENVTSGVYQRMRFKSGTWTCNFYWPDHRTGRQFCMTCLSNNHLLAPDPALARRLMRTRVGDQIYLRGYLAEYSHAGGFRRGTSTTREDSGNGACETIFLEDFQILHTANPVWRGIHRISRFVTLAGVLLGLGLLFFKPVGRQHRPLSGKRP